jgi:threonine aldolase
MAFMSGTPASTPRRTTRQKPALLTPDQEVAAAMKACTRFVNGHGPRTASELLSTIPSDTEIDYYGTGGVVEDLEKKVAKLLGKPAAIFLPSGTMAQQIALRVLNEQRGCSTVAFHPMCHLDSHEERGYQKLHGLFAIPVGARSEPLSVASLEGVHEPVGALLIELPQRGLGGVLPTWSELNAQIKWARNRGAAVHLDGARLWESTSFYKKTPAQIATLFDSVYVSFYKGLGGITGCCVAAEQDVIDEIGVWRTRHGGRLFGMWPYAASAMTVLDQRLPLMPTYYRHAIAIGEAVHDLPNVEVIPDKVQTSMMHLRLSVDAGTLRERALKIARDEKVWTYPRPFASDGVSLQRIELTVGDATLGFEPHEVREIIDRLANGSSKPSRSATKRTKPPSR